LFFIVLTPNRNFEHYLDAVFMPIKTASALIRAADTSKIKD